MALLWREFLEILKEDGVTLSECEYEGITDDGRRITARFLARRVGDRYLSVPAPFTDLSDVVLRYQVRQIANQLKLPFEKYIRNRFY